MTQLNLEFCAVQTLEYPETYRGYSLVAIRHDLQHSDRVSAFRETWSCRVHGNGEFDGKVLSIDDPRAIEAIARAMMLLDIFLGEVKDSHNHRDYFYSKYYDEAHLRIQSCSAFVQPDLS